MGRGGVEVGQRWGGVGRGWGRGGVAVGWGRGGVGGVGQSRVGWGRGRGGAEWGGVGEGGAGWDMITCKVRVKRAGARRWVGGLNRWVEVGWGWAGGA